MNPLTSRPLCGEQEMIYAHLNFLIYSNTFSKLQKVIEKLGVHDEKRLRTSSLSQKHSIPTIRIQRRLNPLFLESGQVLNIIQYLATPSYNGSPQSLTG